MLFRYCECILFIKYIASRSAASRASRRPSPSKGRKPENGAPSLRDHLNNVNAASSSARNGWVAFLGMLAYLAVTLAGITHRDLLLNNPTQLPFVNVRIPLTGFFLFGPLVLLFFHFGLLLQHAHLHNKLLVFSEALGRAGGPCNAENGDIRDELHSYFLAQAVAGKAEERSLAFADRLMTTVTFTLAPVFLLLYFQFEFLPYHDAAFTWVHRLYVIADVVVLLTIGGFLAPMRRAWLQAWPKRHGFWRWTGLARAWGTGAPPLLTATAALVSLFAATLPHETIGELIERTAVSPWPLLERLGAARNLDVSDLDLVPDKSITEGEATLILRGRDFRGANFSRSDLKQADFHGADLRGASLEGANLNGANIGELTNLQGANLKSAQLRGAKLWRTQLEGANLASAQLQNVDLSEAELQGANLEFAELQGANLWTTQLRSANLAFAQLQGANLEWAVLQGATLWRTQLQGANLERAKLQGANLESAQLQGANLQYAELQGVDLESAQLQGANLQYAELQGADLRDAGIWQTIPMEYSGLDLADFSTVKLQAPDGKETALATEQLRDLQVLAKKMQEEKTMGGSAVAEATRKNESIYQKVYQKNDGPGWSEKKVHFCVWHHLRDRPSPDLVRLAEYLGDLACGDKMDGANVARGIIRRFVSSGRKYRPSIPFGAADFLQKLTSCPAVKDQIPADVMSELQEQAKQPPANTPAGADAGAISPAEAYQICAGR